MRIAIGAVLGVRGGPATYARELIRTLATTTDEAEFVVFTDAPGAVTATAPHLTVVPAPMPGAFAQPWWDHVVIPSLVRRYRPDLYHGTKGVLPRRLRCRAVVTIHDLAVYHCPESFAALQRWHQRWELPATVRRATRIIADSAHARRDILTHFGVAADRVAAIPLGVSSIFSATAAADDDATAHRLRLASPYLLYAGTIQPRKNVEKLVEAFAEWHGPPNWELLVAGRLRPGYRPRFVDSPPPRVRYLGVVSDEELATLYRRAVALVSPSAYEGFGLSLLEAMACGCVVVAGGNSAAVELLDGAGLLLETLDKQAIQSALDELARGGPRPVAWRARGLERATGYRWEDTARATFSIYRAAIEATA